MSMRSWDDLNRILRRMCGCFIDIIEPTGGGHAEDKDITQVSGQSLVHLMHQTVKDF